MSYLLHPPLLDETGLPAALSWYVSGLTARGGIKISFKISEDFGRLSREMELVIFRVVQECLTNIHRHSGSETAEIRILRERKCVLVEVRDHGRGIPAEKLARIQTSGSGVGIRGMRERLRQFGGEMAIDSNGDGTTFVVTIPAPQEDGKTRAIEGPLQSSRAVILHRPYAYGGGQISARRAPCPLSSGCRRRARLRKSCTSSASRCCPRDASPASAS